MSEIILETQYFPPLQYIDKWLRFDTIWLEAYEHYVKGSYRNRCHIATSHGLIRLSIPLLKGKNEQMPIREVRISYDQPWQKQHWSSIESAYHRAPLFEHYSDYLMPYFNKKVVFLFDWNLELLQLVIRLLKLPPKLQLTSEYQESGTADLIDFRGGIHPKPQYQQADPWFESKPYPQVFQDRLGFLPNLSILDLLFCKGKL